MRLQAIRALGRLGQRSDMAPLFSAPSDPQWWIRHRAAEALANLPFLDDAELLSIEQHCEDCYGRDAIAQVRSIRALTKD